MYEINCYDSYGNTIDYLTQWDYNRKLIMYIEHYDLSYAPEVHFCNQNSLEALVVPSAVEGNKLTVDIPNILLQEHLSICAYVYLSDANNASSQKTILSVTIPVRYRPKPSEYTYIENITKVTAAQIEENIYNKLKDDLLMIESVEQTKFGNDNNGINVCTIVLTDGTSSEFQFRDGKSAYEHAKDGGYTGTETEFNEMLADANSGHNTTASQVLLGEQNALNYVPVLKIYQMTIDEYDTELQNGNIDENALYITPDENSAAIIQLQRAIGDLSQLSAYGTSVAEILLRLIEMR